MSIRVAFIDAAAIVPDVVEAVAPEWERPSALAGWTVGSLAGHFARAVGTVVRYVDAPPPSVGTVVDGPGYFGAFDRDDPSLDEGVLARGIEAGRAGPTAVAEQARLDVGAAADAVDRSAPDRQLEVFGGLVMSLDEYLRTRLVELVVHHDDLAASVDEDLPALPPSAVEEALAVLVTLAERTHGAPALITALARAERASSISVF